MVKEVLETYRPLSSLSFGV